MWSTSRQHRANLASLPLDSSQFLGRVDVQHLETPRSSTQAYGHLTPFLALWDTLRQKCEFMLDKKPENIKFKPTFPYFELRKIKDLGI